MRGQSRDGSLSARSSEGSGLFAAHVPAKDRSLTGSESVKNKRLVFVGKRGEGLWLPAYTVLGVTGRSCARLTNTAYTRC